MKQTPFLAFVTLLLGACASIPPQPLPTTHPANPDAVESGKRTTTAALRRDEATLTTDRLIKENDRGAAPVMPGMDMR